MCNMSVVAVEETCCVRLQKMSVGFLDLDLSSLWQAVARQTAVMAGRVRLAGLACAQRPKRESVKR